MRAFLDDFSVFGKAMDHLNQLRLCFERCRMARLSLNPAKCAFAVKRGILLRHIISKEGMQIDLRKVAAIQKAKPLANLKELSSIGQIKWHNIFLKYISHVCAPITKLIKKDVKYVWTKEQGKAFRLLKKMLQVAPIMWPLDWGLPFHVFGDTFDIAMEQC